MCSRNRSKNPMQYCTYFLFRSDRYLEKIFEPPCNHSRNFWRVDFARRYHDARFRNRVGAIARFVIFKMAIMQRLRRSKEANRKIPNISIMWLSVSRAKNTRTCEEHNWVPFLSCATSSTSLLWVDRRKSIF